MALSYRVWSEDEDSLRGLLEKGEYVFTVVGIIRKLTKSGNYEMLEVDLEVIDQRGRKRKMRDWIVLMDEMGWKLRHFAATCGLLDKYEGLNLFPNDFMDKKGIVKIAVGEGKDKNGEKTGKKQNHVEDYVKPLWVKHSFVQEKDKPLFDDDVPDII